MADSKSTTKTTYRCSTCGDEKPATDFHRQAARWSGLQCNCKACALTVSAAWRESHRDASRAKDKRHYVRHHSKELRRTANYYARHCERLKAAAVARRLANLEAHRARDKRYRQKSKSKEQRAAIQSNRNARQRAVFVEHVDRGQVFVRDGGICGICGTPVERSVATIDHVIPMSKGGKHEYANVQIAHRRCNERKGAKL